MRPEIAGSLSDDCRASSTCDVEGAGVPAGNNAGLVQIQNTADWVTVDGMSIQDSAGVFMRIYGDDCVIQNSLMEYAYFQVIVMGKDGGDFGGERCVLKQNTFKSWNWARDWSPQFSNGQGGLMVRNHDDADGWGGLIQSNTFIDLGDDRYGTEARGRIKSEVINILQSTHAVVADNLTYGVPQIYCDNCQKTIFERNVCVFPVDPTGPTNCVGSTVEVYGNQVENDEVVYRLNAGINADTPIVVRKNDDLVPSTIEQQEMHWYANTMLGALDLGVDMTAIDADVDGPFFMESNLLFSPDADFANWAGDDSCRILFASSKITRGFNAWDGSAVASICSGTGDTFLGSNAGLVTTATTWNAYSPSNPFSWSDLEPASDRQDGDSSLDNETLAWITDANFPQRTDMDVIGVCNDTEANFQKKVGCDALGNGRALGVEAGAVEFTP